MDLCSVCLELTDRTAANEAVSQPGSVGSVLTGAEWTRLRWSSDPRGVGSPGDQVLASLRHQNLPVLWDSNHLVSSDPVLTFRRHKMSPLS